MTFLHKCTVYLVAAVLCTSLTTVAQEQFGDEASVPPHLKRVSKALRATKATKTAKAVKPAKKNKAGKKTLRYLL